MTFMDDFSPDHMKVIKSAFVKQILSIHPEILFVKNLLFSLSKFLSLLSDPPLSLLSMKILSLSWTFPSKNQTVHIQYILYKTNLSLLFIIPFLFITDYSFIFIHISPSLPRSLFHP